MRQQRYYYYNTVYIILIEESAFSNRGVIMRRFSSTEKGKGGDCEVEMCNSRI